MKLKIVLWKAEEGGYWAKVPGLPGCYSQGETKDEARRNILDALTGWLEVAAEQEAANIKADEGELQEIEV